ncbi:hypothetical protein [Vibrio ziniensis]|uniref:Uncharacterized protein n=1 Tax=Vibrio ziniensis TaxID=2711221 RepID=A0A6G7CMY1_9VIBR|nr:hypothetical protein [Vibrio ziniensis]QIH43455.1 hypothetical protein G5S32_15775 [Vibrio ziniensis]
MISEDAQNQIDSILRNSGSESMTQEEIDFANAINVSPENDCDYYKVAQSVLLERVSMDSNKRFTLVRLDKLAEANGCSLDTTKKPIIKPARIPVIGGGL